MSNIAYNELTPEQQRVIINKGTERPYTGEYTDNKAPGTYICAQCNTPLYESEDKFNSNCGWPSFDDEIKGAVTRVPDADGHRIEIVCTNCKGHLGHVFEGEGFTSKNTRHCVNSISMNFIPKGDPKPKPITQSEAKLDSLILGAGCFWCVEAIFQQIKGVEHVESGYANSKIKNPTYKMVCAGGTEAVEVIKLWYNPDVISLDILLDVFFHVHNPTTLNRQGNDVGDQYRSAIFFENSIVSANAKNVLTKVDKDNLWDDPIVTAIEPLKNYVKAEDYHQNYFVENANSNSYCSMVVAPKVKKFQEKYKHLLR